MKSLVQDTSKHPLVPGALLASICGDPQLRAHLLDGSQGERNHDQGEADSDFQQGGKFITHGGTLA